MQRLFLVLFCLAMGTSCFAQPQYEKNYPDSINKKRLTLTVSGASAVYAGSIGFLRGIWYNQSDRVPFHFYDDSRGYLQMDKAGHAFGAYRQSYTMYYALRWSGVPKKKALLFGGPMGILFQTPIEIFDGLYEGWGFSWYDMIANTAGSTIFTTQQAIFNEQLVLMKFSYSPSPYPAMHSILGETPLENFFLDYNAHTYWLSGNINRISGTDKLPPWLNVAFGYSANGMIKEFDNPDFYQGRPFPELERHRQYIFSLDVDFTRIPTNSRFMRILFRGANMIKVPFPALEYNRVDGFRARALYF